MSNDGSIKSQIDDKHLKKSFNQQTSLVTLDQTMKGSLSFAQISNRRANENANNAAQSPKVIEIAHDETPFEEKLFRDLDSIGHLVAREKKWNDNYDVPKKVSPPQRPPQQKYLTRNVSPKKDLMIGSMVNDQSFGTLSKPAKN